jgi:hypothetical protein
MVKIRHVYDLKQFNLLDARTAICVTVRPRESNILAIFKH